MIPSGEDYFGILPPCSLQRVCQKYFNIGCYLGNKDSYNNLKNRVSPESVFLGNLEFHDLKTRLKE